MRSWLRDTVRLYFMYMAVGLAALPFAAIYAYWSVRGETDWYFVGLPLLGSLIASSLVWFQFERIWPQSATTLALANNLVGNISYQPSGEIEDIDVIGMLHPCSIQMSFPRPVRPQSNTVTGVFEIGPTDGQKLSTDLYLVRMAA